MTPVYPDPLIKQEVPFPPREQASPADRHLWQITPIRDLMWLSGILFCLWFGYYLRGVFTPVIIALLLAYLFNPLIRRAESRWRVPRPVTISVILFVSAVVVLGLITDRKSVV